MQTLLNTLSEALMFSEHHSGIYLVSCISTALTPYKLRKSLRNEVIQLHGNDTTVQRVAMSVQVMSTIVNCKSIFWKKH